MPHDKQKQILVIKDHMFEAVKSHGFSPFSFNSDFEDNFVYSKEEDRVYLTGFSSWERV